MSTKPAPKPTSKNGSNPDEKVQNLDWKICHISDRNTRPRPDKKDPTIISLAESIKNAGQTNPGLVRPHPKKKGEYEIASGARRRVAVELADRPFRAVVREMDDDTFESTILLENFREDPDPKMEVQLMDRMVKRGIKTASALSAELGRPEHWVARRLPLLDVIPELRKQWEGGEKLADDNDDGRGLGIGHFTVEMMAFLGSLPENTQRSFLERDQYKRFENYELGRCDSYSQLRKYVTESVMCRLDTAPFDLDDPRFFVKDCGPGCASDSSKQGVLFGHTTKDARCLNCSCFLSRLAKFRKVNYDEVTLGLSKEQKDKLSFVFSRQEGGYERRPDSIRIGNEEVEVEDKGYDQEICKAGDKGAERVILVASDGKLRLGYLKTKKGYGGSSSKPKSQKKSLETRKTILQSRRWNIVREELVKKIMASSAKDVTVDVLDLVPIFGFSFHADPLRNSKHDNTLWKEFDARKKAGFVLPALDKQVNTQACSAAMLHRDSYSRRELVHIKDRNEAIWHGLKPVIVDQLLHFRLVSEIIADHGVTDIERVGKLIAFDTAKAKKAADLQLTPPRTWGKVDVHTLAPLK